MRSEGVPTEANLEEGFAELEELSKDEYHVTLTDLIQSTDGHADAEIAKVGRLIGVTLKQPFATPIAVDTPSAYTGAFRRWELDASRFDDPTVQTSWQYRTAAFLREDQNVIQVTGGQPSTVLALAQTAHHERGYFGYLLLSCRGYLCGDQKIRNEINRKVAEVRKNVGPIAKVTPEYLVGAGGMGLGILLVQAIPVLGLVGAPVIAGLVLLIYSLNVDALCKWSEDHPFEGHAEQN